jgi:hypothetical protein
MIRLHSVALLLALCASSLFAQQDEPLAQATIDGSGPDWLAIGQQHLENVNGNEDTWSFGDGLIKTTGQPVGVIRTKKQYTNFELVVEWRHLRKAGNSGVFVWVPPKSLDGLPKGALPHGIEVQVLDTGYAEQYTQSTGKQPDWFTSHGDVFAVGSSKMKPFPPLSPDGSRSFPSQNLTRDVGQWNHYYVRAINGEVRLWVNGQEVSGGTACEPASGYLCLESEGSPVEFRGLKIRELP